MGGSLPTSSPCHGCGRHCEKPERVIRASCLEVDQCGARHGSARAGAQCYNRKSGRAIQRSGLTGARQQRRLHLKGNVQSHGKLAMPGKKTTSRKKSAAKKNSTHKRHPKKSGTKRS